MFKILLALSLFVAIQGQLVGGFMDRPDLLNSPMTDSMVKLAVKDLAQKSNLNVSPIKILEVATQVVNGINYRITFTARPYATISVLTCTTKIYQPFQGPESVSSAACH